MDAFFAMFIKKRKNGRRIPADAWVSLKHEETEKVTSFYNRAKIYSSRHPLQIFFPISLGNSWILVLINMKINAPAQLSVYAPFIEKKGRVEEVVRAVINSITMFYSDKEPDGSDLEWKEVNMLTDLPGRHAKSMIESAGFIMSYVRDLGKLNNPTNWQVAAFQVAIEMLEPQRVSSTVYDEVDTLDDYSSE